MQLPLPVSLDHFLPSCDDALGATGEASVERNWGSQPAARTNLKWLQLRRHEMEISHPHHVLPNCRFKSKINDYWNTPQTLIQGIQIFKFKGAVKEVILTFFEYLLCD